MAEIDNPFVKTTAVPRSRAAFYNQNIGSKLGDPARCLLETYSNIPSGDIEKHIYEIVILRFPFPTFDQTLTEVYSAIKRGMYGPTHALGNSGSSIFP